MRAIKVLCLAAGTLAVASCAIWRDLTGREASSNGAEKNLRTDVEITEAKWTAPGADIVKILTTEPAECLAAARDNETQYLADVGRAAFNSPFLLGGQAARARLTCNSCHRSGGDNPDFFLDGLSGAPGAADVTSSIFSKVREDNDFNPVPIPTLVDSGEKNSFGSHGVSPELNASPESMLAMKPPDSTLALKAFVASAITDEFQGEPPSEVILDGLTAYISHLKSDACAADDIARTVHVDVAKIAGTISVAIESLKRGENDTASLLVLTAQNRFVDIYERFNISGFNDERTVILDRAEQLARIRPAVAAGEEGAEIELAAFRTSLEQFAKYLGASSEQSLYNRDVLIDLLGLEETEESI